MVKYVLFGQQVIFDNPAERNFDLQYACWTAVQDAQTMFSSWYDNCKRIERVINDYKSIAGKMIGDLAYEPLYKTLIQYDIYDVSKDTYWRQCADFSETEEALQVLSQKYHAIDQKKAEIENYRAARKAGRGRWQGGGFGFSGAIKGAAMAGGMNLLSGMAHSAFNAVGNAGTSLEASDAKRSLYGQKATKDMLFEAIVQDMFAFFGEHSELINERRPGSIRNVFDPERAAALFENAKNLPDKRKALLVQAITLCPWSDELVKYIFVNYPEERKPISALAQRFHVDLSDKLEALLEREYREEDRSSEAAAQRAKQRIRAIMRDYNITSSPTLDKLESDCLARICKGYENASVDTCFAIKQSIHNYEAQEHIKNAYLDKIQQRIIDIWKADMESICDGYEQADEAACNKIKDALLAYGAPNDQKEPFFQKIQKRIEDIWSAEDGKTFDELYLATDITDPSAIKRSVAFIREKARTVSSEKYISALEACNPKNITKARSYRKGIKPGIYATLGLMFLFLAVSNLFFLKQGILISGLCIVVSVVFAGLYGDLSKPWKELTIDNTVLHSVLTKDLPERKKGIPPVVIALVIVALMTILAEYGIPVTTADTSEVASTPAPIVSSKPTQTPAKEVLLRPLTPDPLYETVLTQYASMVITADDTLIQQGEMSSMCLYNQNLDDYGYVCLDINGDGIQELLIGGSTMSQGYFYDLYTIVDSQIVHVCSSHEKDMYNLCVNGTLAEVGHIGDGEGITTWEYYYRLDSQGNLVLLGGIQSDMGPNGTTNLQIAEGLSAENCDLRPADEAEVDALRQRISQDAASVAMTPLNTYATQMEPGSDNSSSGYPVFADMNDMLQANIIGSSFDQATFRQAYSSGYLDEWMSLYFYGTDPGATYPDVWYSPQLEQWTYYGFTYDQAEKAGWGDIWMGQMESTQTSDEYLMPTDQSYITQDQLALYNRQRIMLIRNEIYARHGCQFSDTDIQAYFDSQSWYVPIEGLTASTFDITVLNEYEATNLQTILNYETSMGWR